MVHSANYRPGESGNPNGRPPGAVNKRSEELARRLRERGDKDPADFLSGIVTNEQEPKELRVAAANYLLPYLYSKRGSRPEAPDPVFIEHQVKLQPAKTIPQARDNIIYLTELKALGQIDQVWGDNLIADQYKILSALVDEAKIAIQGGEQGDSRIVITGGLPDLPGTNIIHPQINGHDLELQAIESKPPDSIPNDTTDQSREP
jgi:hypothetical protein